MMVGEGLPTVHKGSAVRKGCAQTVEEALFCVKQDKASLLI